MSRKFLPLFIAGFLALILAFAMILGAPFFGSADDSGSEEAPQAVIPEQVESFQEKMRRILNETKVSELDLNEATIGDAFEFLRPQSGQPGFSYIVRSPKKVSDDPDSLGDGENPSAKTISLTANDVGIAEALDLVCEKAGLRWHVDEEDLVIVISPPKVTR